MVSHPRRRDARRHGARRHRHPNRQSWDNCHATYWLLSARVGRGPPPPTTYYEVLLPSGGTGWVPVTAARLEAELVIDRWNRRLATGRDMLSSPTIRAALVADTPWLDVFCPGCGTNRAIDLRTVDRHPLASVGTLVLGLRCSWCPGSAPMPKLLGLYALPPANRAREGTA
jgi:hypothetical protein